MLRVLIASFHLLALGLGLYAVLTRGTVLRAEVSSDSLRRAFRADNLWAAAAFLWLATGLWRVFGALEKPTAYYLNNDIFLIKMMLFVLMFVLEVWPMRTLMRWRAALRRGEDPAVFASRAAATRVATISHAEALVVVLMIFAATAMARGYGA